MKLEIKNQQGEVLAAAEDAQEITLVYEPQYKPGDVVELTGAPSFVALQLDDAVAPSLVFLREGRCAFPIPLGEQGVSCSPRAYTGRRHLLYARAARPEEVSARRNLACNTFATHEPGGPFPFARANVETRGESVFAAKNAIDGVKASHFHGEWPFTSWGINRDPHAALTVEFGRRVRLDEAVFYLRADFPHDAWWRQATLHFSGGEDMVFPLEKTPRGQRFPLPGVEADFATLDSLLKAEDPSPFPALTQLELWGTEA